MNKPITYLSLILIGFLFLSCNKVKLEDERSKQLIGKWKFQYAGMIQSSTEISNWESSIHPYQEYWIQFYENGEFCLINNQGTSSEKINFIGQLDNSFNTYGKWHNRYHYDKKDDGVYFELHYFGDSIVISHLPYNMSGYGSQYGNVYYRQ